MCIKVLSLFIKKGIFVFPTIFIFISCAFCVDEVFMKLVLDFV